jgi:hypothetical protein
MRMVQCLWTTAFARRAAQVRWDGLFADLEAQADQLERAERAGEVEERTRGELARQTLHARLRAAAGSRLRVVVASGLAISGDLRRTGSDWMLLDAGSAEWLVPTAPLRTISGLGRQAAVEAPTVVDSRLDFRHALRGLTRDRAQVRVHLLDGSSFSATLDRVGADFVDAAVHPAGEARRPDSVRDVAAIAIAALAALRRG